MPSWSRNNVFLSRYFVRSVSPGAQTMSWRMYLTYLVGQHGVHPAEYVSSLMVTLN